MQTLQIPIKKLDARAVMPSYGSEYAAGADLCALLDNPAEIQPGQTFFIPTGLAVEIPEGFVGLICARSGLSCKYGVAPANKIGVIDSDYRGELQVALFNHSQETYTIQPGERIAQLLIIPYAKANFTITEQLNSTARGTGSFGSTGK